jgi:hypothetical protein
LDPDLDPGGHLITDPSGSYLEIFVAIEKICFKIGSKSLQIKQNNGTFFLTFFESLDPDSGGHLITNPPIRLSVLSSGIHG